MLESNDPSKRAGRSRSRGYVQLALILVVIAIALYFARAPSREIRFSDSDMSPVSAQLAVRVIHPTPTDHSLTVNLTGSVTLEEKTSVVSEVVGRVVWVSPQFSNGGSFEENETFIRIDPTKIELEVEVAAMAVQEAEAKVWSQKARGEDNARRFSLENPGAEASEWIRRLPKIAEAEAALRRAQAELKLAELRLEHTNIALPYDGRVMTSDVEVGELVGPVNLVGRTSLGVVYRPRALQVDAPIEPRDLEYLRPVIGRRAQVIGETRTWNARVVRISSIVAPKTRLASVFLKFPENARASSLPVPGTFVEVGIAGPAYRDVFVLPEAAMQDGDSVWIVERGVLRAVELNVLGRTAEGLLARAFDAGEGVVVGRPPGAREGLVVAVTD